MQEPFDPSVAKPDRVFGSHLARWRQVWFWVRIILWVIVALEYSALNPGPQLGQAAVILLALGCAILAERRPALVVGELAAVAYLVLEERDHYVPIMLCLLVAGHAAFCTKVPLYVLYAAATIGLTFGFAEGTYPFGAWIRCMLIITVALVCGRAFREALDRLAADFGAGVHRLLDLGFSDSPAFVDFAAHTTWHLDQIVENDCIVTGLRRRIKELETATAAAQAALSIADYDELNRASG